jgi:hypothetical protein
MIADTAPMSHSSVCPLLLGIFARAAADCWQVRGNFITL